MVSIDLLPALMGHHESSLSLQVSWTWPSVLSVEFLLLFEDDLHLILRTFFFHEMPLFVAEGCVHTENLHAAFPAERCSYNTSAYTDIQASVQKNLSWQL